jgi:hypothetical protein
MFVCYLVLLGTITYHLSTPEQSLLGRFAGGFFIYAISIMDAYRAAALNARPDPATAQDARGRAR